RSRGGVVGATGVGDERIRSNRSVAVTVDVVEERSGAHCSIVSADRVRAQRGTAHGGVFATRGVFLESILARSGIGQAGQILFKRIHTDRSIATGTIQRQGVESDGGIVASAAILRKRECANRSVVKTGIVELKRIVTKGGVGCPSA